MRRRSFARRDARRPPPVSSRGCRVNIVLGNCDIWERHHSLTTERKVDDVTNAKSDLAILREICLSRGRGDYTSLRQTPHHLWAKKRDSSLFFFITLFTDYSPIAAAYNRRIDAHVSLGLHESNRGLTLQHFYWRVGGQIFIFFYFVVWRKCNWMECYKN